MPTVSVALVTYNSLRYIGRCLEALLGQQGIHLEVVAVDNASADGTLEVLERHAGRVRVIRNQRNLGFAEAQNQAIGATSGEWVLAMNPDVLMQPDFVRRLYDAAQIDPGVGAVCGRLLSIGPDFVPLESPRFDSTGMYFTPSLRHFDRGWHEPVDGQFTEMEYVFGASAAAALYRRKMIEDISCGGEFFDPDFFAYREDADVAWRAQLLGWRCLYTPDAVAHHVRRVVPGNRRALPAMLNMHGVKNRFLMRIKNATPGLYKRFWLPMTARDAVVMGACLLWEPTSLAAFWHVARGFGRALRRRREIMSRRRASEQSLLEWFRGCGAGLQTRPEPAGKPAAARDGCPTAAV